MPKEEVLLAWSAISPPAANMRLVPSSDGKASTENRLMPANGASPVLRDDLRSPTVADDVSSHVRDEPKAAPESPDASDIKKPEVLEVRVYRGPNPYGYRPVIRVMLDLGVLED